MKKIPVNIISGFLGAGKTTAIIQLLSQKLQDECWAIVVNEFGKVSIDGQTLQSKSTTGSVYSISGGCICCSAKAYLKDNLEMIAKTGKFNRIIVEPSGLGGIEMVSEIIESLPGLIRMPVICLVDILGIDNQRLQRNMIYLSQISMSERIVFSKCDLLDEIGQQDQLVKKFKSKFPEKHFCMAGSLLTTSVLTPDTLHKNEAKTSFINAIPAHYLEDKNYREFNLTTDRFRTTDSEKLKMLFCKNSAIVRAKGHIHTENGWRFINYTLTGFSDEVCDEKNSNQLVVIFRKKDPTLVKEIIEYIEQCFA